MTQTIMFFRDYVKQRATNSFWGVIVAVFAFTLTATLCNFTGRFEFDPDESNNLMKALLLDRGFSLGKDIWTDQPPLYSYLLFSLFKLFGSSVALGRFVTLGFSSLLLFFLYDSLRIAAGHRHALGSCVFLLTSASYLPLSVSVMIGLPSIAFCVGSLWCLTRSLELLGPKPFQTASPRTRVLHWCIASGVFFGLSLGTKLFTLFLAPLLGLVALGGPLFYEQPRTRRALVPALGWSLSLAVALFFCFFPLLLERTWSGLIEAHAHSRELRSGDLDGIDSVLSFLRADVTLFALSILSLPFALLTKRRKVLLYLGWLALALAALADHHPVWPHHRLLLTVPAAALSGFVTGEILRLALHVLERAEQSRAKRWLGSSLGAVALSLASVSPAYFTPKRLAEMRAPKTWADDKKDWMIFSEFEKYAKLARFTAAGRPMFSFRANRPVPPNLAVTSWKRFHTGLLSGRAVEKSIKKFSPEVVLLSSRWPKDVQRRVRDQLRPTHSLVKSWSYQSTELWVQNSLVKEPIAEAPRIRGRR